MLEKILCTAPKGTTVTSIVGNHDEELRHLRGYNFGAMKIVDEAVHIIANGRRFLILHGDFYDNIIQRAKWLAYFGGNLYACILKLNHWFNTERSH